MKEGSGSELKAGEVEREKSRRVRLKPIHREQMMVRPVEVEKLVAEDHEVRGIWEFVGRLDLSQYYEEIEGVEGEAGRPALDPRLMISLWIYAYSKGIRSAREISRLCEYDPAYQWLTGLEAINYHTLSDFRVKHKEGLDELFTEILGILSAEGLITLERVRHDGTKVKACASFDTFRREERVRAHWEAAREQVEQMGDARTAEQMSPRVVKARQRAVREKQQRLEKALRELEKIRACKSGPEEKKEARVSMSDPEAFHYDAVSDTYLCPGGKILRLDGQEKRPGRTNYRYRALAVDCQRGSLKKKGCPQNEAMGRTIVRGVDDPVVVAHIKKMEGEKAKGIYRQRGAVAEFPNAWIKDKIGLRQFRLRGLIKVGMEILWACLTYNIKQWIRLCWRPRWA